jgi:3'-5' exoribonuclease
MGSSDRRFVCKLSHNEQVDQVFLASDKQLRPNRNGNLYLQVELSDRSGSISARLWNATDSDYKAFENGDYVHVDGATQVFQGIPQLIANRIRKANKSEVDESDFLTLSSPQIDKMAIRLAEILRTIKQPQLRSLAECFLMDQDFMKQFTNSAAGIKNHHAYQGGLLEHVVSLMEVMLLVAPRYPALNLDLLLIGAFLHDAGKIQELSSDRDLAYTDVGQLLGHIVLAITMVDAKLAEVERLSGEPLSPELEMQLKHLIISHHGEYEYGSPKLPMTLEAVALHYLDNLDAKLHNFQSLMASDSNTDSPWTQFQHNLGRKLYKGPLG